MITPFRFNDIFKPNPDSKIVVEDNIVYIDDFFSDFDRILDLIYNMNVEVWKHGDDSRNFVDYYDCRHTINNPFVKEVTFNKTIIDIIRYFYSVETYPTEQNTIGFNYFKSLKKDVPNSLQHFPHRDRAFNVLVYLDNESNGGTAIYDIDYDLKNTEETNLLCDVSDFKLKTIVKAKQNRCVIFDGNQYHGGHIDDYEVYYNSWRINLVNFYECILPGS